MPTGKLLRLVHLSQQPCVLNTRLVPDHNDKGYGVIQNADGGQVYFSHEAVESRFGFDRLQEGQRLYYTLESGPFLRAVAVCEAKENTEVKARIEFHPVQKVHRK
jgi:cold shock CspA family protein